MTDQVKEIISETVLQILTESTSTRNINSIVNKHVNKIHFIPIRYRVIGGILQGLNIKFGNFIEKLLMNLEEIDTGITVLKESGKKVRLYFTPATDALIDNYITKRQLPNSVDDCTLEFDDLLNQIIKIETNADPSSRQGIVKDIDGLFLSNKGLKVYTELKYNDDHDTGKFADINRKFIKTWAGLAVLYRIKDPKELLPIIYYFNSTKRYGPIHTPSRNIMRGPQLFDAFLQTKYSDVDKYLSGIGEDPEILKLFDDLYKHVREMNINIESHF